MSIDNLRAVKLSKHLDSIIQGRQPLTSKNSALFFEAICATPDAATCINTLIASEKGLQCLQASFRFDTTYTFFNGHAATLLEYFSAPGLASISGGSFLRQVLLAIVEPPIFWTPFKEAFLARKLQENAQFGFAWLLLQLILLPGDQANSYRALAQNPSILDMLLASKRPDVRSTGQKIKHVITTHGDVAPADLEHGPGGRHDNDFVDFREIAILPTADELHSKDQPFIRPSSMLDDPDTESTRLATHLDNQFRLLREDMLYEMREELQVALGLKKGQRRGFVIDGLTLHDIHYKISEDKKCKWGIEFKCRSDFWQFIKDKPKDRKQYLKDNRNVFKHQSMACLILDGEIAAFATVYRDEGLLAEKPPIVVLRLEGQTSVVQALIKLHRTAHIKLLQIDTAVFSYEPILTALQKKQSLTLASEVLFWNENNAIESPSSLPSKLVEFIEANPLRDLQGLLKTSRPIVLDKAQAASLLCGLTQRVSLIQGPPGTGKSFIGALLAKVLHDSAQHTILVVCYTNHALDQFLEDLLDIGIPHTSIIRLGGKSTTRTAPLALRQQNNARGKLGKADWREIDSLKVQSERLSKGLVRDFEQYKSFKPNSRQIMEHLEFSYSKFSEAFHLPQSTNGMKQVGKKGQAAGPYYLMGRWVEGLDAGNFKSAANVAEASEIWGMSRKSRKTHFNQWKQEILNDLVENFCKLAGDYNRCQSQLDRKFGDGDAQTLRSKRIIGCTTTAAAMYREDIDAARPGVLLVEEAGEILESHVLTALGAETKQLILIGDHKQLRPKVNNYLLTVEKGEGYDLNRSLFERLVLKGYPHETLREQHRMRPEISTLVRQLTYPDLVDAAKTQNRPNLLGVRDNVIFINHDKPEDEFLQLEERKDIGAKSSKQNRFEVQMVLKTLRYLGQQGYGTSKIVILTPYLGQLRELQEALKKDNDPVLNDLDSYDLVRAGLVSSSAAKIAKAPIRLATIDNYQGEESDIVIASLTRSNTAHDIGFMSSPERLTVLLSRARNAFIMIGNSDTFINARKGSEIWKKLFELLRRNGHIYDGLPVKCERHPDRIGLMKCADDFDKECPDGGCLEPCGTTLSCSLHSCPSKCHQLVDHSKMLCESVMHSKCSNGHPQQWKCHKGPPASCLKCDQEKKTAEKKRQEEFALQKKRDEDQRLHAQQMAELDDQIARTREALRDTQLAEERKHALQQKEKDLKDATILAAKKASVVHTRATPPLATPQQPVSPSNSRITTGPASDIEGRPVSPKHFAPPVKSGAREKWQRRKDIDGEINDAIDAIMEMTGLEEVKEQVLRIKDKVDTALRQNTSLKGERFNVSMLGNPGTGKTTVARHYGKFLASVQVIPGNLFKETTGSRLANDGVPGVKKMLEDVVGAGGGTIFVDEAYQLTSEHNFQGKNVLDFLLAEMENNIGKVVFIFAGYNKEMEKFFEHNPGLKSRLPYTLQFKDYQDEELLGMLENLIEKKYSGRMQVEDGIRGLYGRIAVRRLGRGRGRDGFGNARALANMFAKICERQAERLSKERTMQGQPDDFLFTKEDLIGPAPSEVMLKSVAWKELQSMIGLAAIKKSVTCLFSMVDTNYQRELLEKELHQVSLNRVFLGSPGTGKTTVAKHYGQILADLGLISNGEVVVKNPADFIGNVLGQSESQTKAILGNTVGKVLIIDEAYMLYGGSGGNNAGDSYKTAVIDTIVAEVQSVPGEDRCVLLLGYKEQIEDMFQNVNPGLARRFDIENAFHFSDYTDSELLQALEWKLKRGDLTATDAAKTVAIEVLARARIRPNFGNIGEVENLLGKAKSRYQTRQESLPRDQRSPDAPFEPQDFDPEFNRNENAATNLAKLFEDVVGCEETIKKLGTWQEMARNMKARGKDARGFIPTNFVFKGPPGTGKTTTARKMGQVYYDMGFLSSTEVVECSASDLVGQYVGHTGPKTRKLFEKALGRVLFIDEAYRLSEGHFAKEAMDELVGILTQEKFRGKLVVILAGYGPAMNELMAVNDGLSSRFPNEIFFHNLHPVQCMEVLKRKLEKLSIHVDALEDTLSAEYLCMVDLLRELSSLPSWGNARDLEELSKQMMTVVFTTPSPSEGAMASNPDDVLRLAGKDALNCLESMLTERRERTTNLPARSRPLQEPQQVHEHQAPPPPVIHTTQTTHEAPPPPYSDGIQQEEVEHRAGATDIRDAGVTDQVWHDLQLDKQKAADEIRRSQEAVRLLEQELRDATQREELAKALTQQLARANSERAELMREREEARLREIAANEERERRAAALEEERRKRQEEEKVQNKLRQMGRCVAGFAWIKQASGYRCAGGGHFVGNAALGI